MANETFLDASGATKYRKSTGAGTSGDPAVAHNIIDGTVTVTGAGGTFPVTDSGGSLTVDGTVAATQSGTWNVTNISGTVSLPTGAATELTQTANQTLLTSIDASLADITRAEDAVHTSGNRGVVGLAVRRDTLTGTAADGDYITLSTDSNGRLYVNSQVTAALPAGTNNIGDVDILSIAAGTNLIGDFGIGVRTGSGGLTGHTAVSAASNNATSVKASAGRVYAIIATNNGAAARYLKFYNKASAPSPASDTPVATYMLPAGGGLCRITDIGLVFSTGIAYAIVAGIGVTNNTSISADEVAVNIEYA